MQAGLCEKISNTKDAKPKRVNRIGNYGPIEHGNRIRIETSNKGVPYSSRRMCYTTYPVSRILSDNIIRFFVGKKGKHVVSIDVEKVVYIGNNVGIKGRRFHEKDIR